MSAPESISRKPAEMFTLTCPECGFRNILFSTSGHSHALICKGDKDGKVCGALIDPGEKDQSTEDQLRRKIVKLKREVRIMQKSLEEKNKELDAMHYVWCTGACSDGIHRYDKSLPTLTQDLINRAHKNLMRMVTRWINEGREQGDT